MSTTTRVRPHKGMTGEELRRWRAQQPGDYAWKNNQRKAGWSQFRAAEWYGVNERQWRRYETGESGIPLPLVKRMVAYEANFDKTMVNLYVIRLDDDVLKLDQFREQNPNYRSGKPCMYVGVTSHDPQERFKQDKNGYKNSPITKKYGKYLMWKKFRHLNPAPANEAEERERGLVTELRRKGYGVWQNS